MVQGVVYEGVAAGLGGDEGEGLFSGYRFWISARVPMRNRLISMVENNGGEVVRLEKQANVLIADHVRKDAPPHSYSWRFIDESVKKGRLENLDDHLIHRAAAARHAAAAAGTGGVHVPKGTRHPFTSADDEVLTSWVAAREKAGHPVRGNVIYQELAQQYPHHTWQSWRDRWVKKLSFLHHAETPDRPDNAVELPTPSISRQGGAPHPPRPPPLPRVQQPEMPRHPAPPNNNHNHNLNNINNNKNNHNHNRAGDPPSRPQRAHEFTADDDQLLSRLVEAARILGDVLSEDRVFIELGNKYPHHSWQAWKQRYLALLKDRQHTTGRPANADSARRPRPVAAPDGRGGAARDAEPARPETAGSSHGGRRSRRRETRENNETSGVLSTAAQSVKTEEEQSDAAAAATLRQVPDIVQELEARKRTVGAARTIQRVWRGYRVRRDLERLSRFQAVAKGALIRMVLREETDDEQQDGCSSAQNTTSPRRQTPALQPLPEHRAPQANRDPTEKELFYRDLQAVITHTHMKVNYWPRIGRRVIELWDLWRAVRAQDAAPDMRNWEGIAEALDFDWISDPMVTRKIKSCFEANLGRFERLMDEWRQLEEAGGLDDGGGGEGGEGPAGETEAAAEDEAADKATTTGHAVSHQTVAPPSPPAASSPVVGASHFSSSPPRLRGLKRLFDPDLVSSSDPAYPESSSRKRTRYAKDAEIPSTPDDKTGIDRLARNKARRPPVRESPSHAATAAAAAAAAAPESTTGSATSRSQQLPLLPRTPREAKQKPRSAYVVENADDDDDQDPENEFRSQVGLDSQGPTPSQQLRSEDRLYSSPPSTRRPLFADRSLPRAQGGQSSIATNQNSRGGLAEDDANASRASVPSAVESVEEAHQRPRVVHRSLPPSFRRPGPSHPPTRAQEGQRSRASDPEALARTKASASARTGSRVSDPTPSARSARQPPLAAAAGAAAAAAPVMPTHPLPLDASDPSSADLVATIERFMAMGYPQAVVIQGLKATCLAHGEAGVAMESLMRGDGLPQRHEGIWTARDDEGLARVESRLGGAVAAEEVAPPSVLESLDAAAMEARARALRERARLERKHGLERMRARSAFLKAWGAL